LEYTLLENQKEFVQQKVFELKSLADELQKHAFSKEVSRKQLSKQEIQRLQQKEMALEQLEQKWQHDIYTLQKEAIPRKTINELHTQIDGLENKLRILKNVNEKLEEEIRELNKLTPMQQTPSKKN